jgi:hypothetical protein
MPPDAPSLAEVQARLQAAIMAGDDGILKLIPGNSRTSNEVLLGVYRHAYVARLVEIVRAAYPLLAQHMGDAAFDAAARGYVLDRPSRHTNARWYAGELPDFLGAGPYDAAPELREIALIERQLDLAFDARDADVLDLSGLAAYPPDAWSSLTFVAHPSVALLSLTTNAFEIWLALKNGADRPEIRHLAESDHALVWREGTVSKIRRLGAEERMLWSEASRGVSFGGLMELAAVFDDPDTAAIRVAQYLQGWLGSGLISAAVTTASEAARV